MCKYTGRFICVDLRTLQTIIRVANQRLHQEERFAIDNQIEDSRERHQRATLEFKRVFNLHKVLSNAARENMRFTNCIRTERYAVDFILAKRTNMYVLPNLELEDFVPEVQNTFRLWDLDLARNLYSPRLMDIQMTNKALKTVEREGLLAFVGIDEYNTSQVRLDLLYGL
ncbi:hypothetical protein G6F56_002217 [Rhizopus delemar]|nr:hypothetical protein G6F56_002217 [Rhizopus delemar]